MIGVDVGSQGTGSGHGVDGTLVTASYAAHELSYPAPAGPNRTSADWLRALVATLSRGARDVSTAAQSPRCRSARSSTGWSQRGRTAAWLHRALIWCDRRASEECDEVAARVDPAELRALTGCNIDPSHVGPKIAWLVPPRARRRRGGRLPAPRLTGGLASLRRTRRRSVERVLDWPTRPARGARGRPQACDAYRVDADKLAPVVPAHAPLGPIAPWLLRRDRTRRSKRWSSWGAATRWRPRSVPASSSLASCATCSARPSRCARSWPSPAHDPTGVVELDPHADPDTWLLENPGWLSGGAYRWFCDELGTPEIARADSTGEDVYELLNALAGQAPPGADGVIWLPALAGAMAPGVESARARGLVRAHGRARARAPHARAHRGQRAGAARRAQAIATSGADAPREVVCVGGGARGRLLLRSPRRRHRAAGGRGPRMWRRRHVGRRCWRRPGRASTRASPRAARAMAGPRGDAVEPDPGRRAVDDDLHERYRRVYDALLPLFV